MFDITTFELTQKITHPEGLYIHVGLRDEDKVKRIKFIIDIYMGAFCDIYYKAKHPENSGWHKCEGVPADFENYAYRTDGSGSGRMFQ